LISKLTFRSSTVIIFKMSDEKEKREINDLIITLAFYIGISEQTKDK